MDLFRKDVDYSNLKPKDVFHMNAHLDQSGLWWYSLIDIYKILENTSGQAHINLFAKKNQCIESKIINKEWNQVENKWESRYLSESSHPMIPEHKIEDIVLLIINKTRKSLSQKSDLCKKLNVYISDSQLKIPIECSVLDILIKSCPFKVETQYRIGKYKLDAFIPRLRMAIQIDENGHKNYNIDEEKEYDAVIRDHGIVCIRFVPDESQPLESGLRLISQIWNHTISPDYSDFKAKLM
jgi:very-short-patch-repair endonuclease